MYEEKKVKNYKYDAFISYRHTELDRFVAEKIQKYLEEFKLPKNIKGKNGLKKTKIERVFRDKEELTITNNLEDPILVALKASEYLIVICSPRIKESVWCRKEIEKFIEYHGRNKILTVLIEGEPEESFPEELLFEEEIINENGVETIHRKKVEPLAADIRGKSKRQMCALLKTELLRVIAPIFGLEYDDLRQRHRERKVKRIITATVVAAGLGLTIGVAGVASALVINNQKDKIQEQNNKITTQNEKLLKYQAESLTDKALEYLEQDRREEAINTALSSVTKYEGTDMPYTAKGRYALTQSLRVYDIGNSNKAQNQFVAQANIIAIKLSPSKNFAMAIDKTKNVYVWDVVTGELVEQIDDLAVDIVYDTDINFVGDSMLAYSNNKNKLVVRNFENHEDKVIVDESSYVMCIKGDATGRYLAVYNLDEITVYDIINGKDIYKAEAQENKIINYDFVWCNDKLIYIEEERDAVDNTAKISRNIKVVDVKSGNVTEAAVDFNDIDGASSLGGYIYIIGSNFGSTEAEKFGIVLAVEENSGQIVWQNKYNERVINKMEIAEKDGEGYVAVSFYSELICLDAKTGSEYYKVPALEGISDFVMGENGCGQILDLKGQLIAFSVFEQKMYGMEYYLQCKVSKIDNLKICEDGYLVLPMASNYIIKYGITDNKDKEAYVADEVMKSDMEKLWCDFADCTEEAEKIGVTNPELVANILYVDENVAMVVFWDMTMDIYDVVNKNVINSLTDIKSVPVQYFGDDNEGNIYITGYTCGYCFDKDYNLIAEIDNLKYVEVEKGYMIIGEHVGELWKLPIYSLEELIGKAEDW